MSDRLAQHVPDETLERINRAFEYVPLGLYDEVTKLAEYALGDILRERLALVEIAKAAQQIINDQSYDEVGNHIRVSLRSESFDALRAALARLGEQTEDGE